MSIQKNAKHLDGVVMPPKRPPPVEKDVPAYVDDDDGTMIGKHYDKQDKLIDLLIMYPTQSKYAHAVTAGYAIKSIDKRVPQLFRNKKFLDRLEQRKQQIQDQVSVSADKVAEEYARIAFLDPGDYYKFNDKGQLEAKKSKLVDLRPVVTIKQTKGQVSLEFYDKMAALKSLRDMFGYDKPSKHAVGIIGDGSGINQQSIEAYIFGLLGGAAPALAPKALDEPS